MTNSERGLTSSDVAFLGCIIGRHPTIKPSERRVIGYILELKKPTVIDRYNLVDKPDSGASVDFKSKKRELHESGVVLLNVYEACNLISDEAFNGRFDGIPSDLPEWESLIEHGIYRNPKGVELYFKRKTKSHWGYCALCTGRGRPKSYETGGMPIKYHFVDCDTVDISTIEDSNELGELTYVVRKGFEVFKYFVRTTKKLIDLSAGRQEKHSSYVADNDSTMPSTDISSNIDAGVENSFVITPESTAHDDSSSNEQTSGVSELEGIVTTETIEDVNTVGEEFKATLEPEVDDYEVTNREKVSVSNREKDTSAKIALPVGRKYFIRGGILTRVDVMDTGIVYITCELSLDDGKYLIMSTNNSEGSSLDDISLGEYITDTSHIKDAEIHKILSPYWEEIDIDSTESAKMSCIDSFPFSSDVSECASSREYMREMIISAIEKFFVD